jgi:hypothetical protein
MDKQLPTTPKPTSPPKRAESPDAIDVLFARLLFAFGTQWQDRWQGIPMEGVKAEWRRALGAYPESAINSALDSLARTAWKFPPNLSEFADLCRQFRSVGETPLRLADNRRGEPMPAHVKEAFAAILRKAQEDA